MSCHVISILCSLHYRLAPVKLVVVVKQKNEADEVVKSVVNYIREFLKRKSVAYEVKVIDDDDEDDDGDDDDGEGGFVSIPKDREYKYEELLDRMYSLLIANNPELAGDRRKFLMKPPQVVREGSKRVVFINFGDICKSMNRTLDHVYSFMLAEMGTTGSIDASSRMVIKGRFPPKAIEQIIRRYVAEYVTCSSCKSPATALQKQNRLYFMQCNNCGARRSVAPIKTGFVAISKGARKKNRQ